MIKKLYSTVLALSVFMLANATGDSTKSRITEAYLLGGGYSDNNSYITLSQYQALNPDSKILLSNFSGFNSNTLYRNNSASMLYLGVGYKLKSFGGPTVRFGLGVGSGNSIQGGYYKNETTHIDTLISPRTGNKAFVDSVYNEYYDFSTRSDIVQLDVSAVWRTKNPNRMTLFGGIGVFAGTSFNVFSTITHSINYYNIYPEPSNYNRTNTSNHYTSDNETFKNKNHSVYGIYIPFGADLRLGKKSTFWKNFHLVFEARVRLQKYNFGGIGSESSTPYNGLFGIRYKFS